MDALTSNIGSEDSSAMSTATTNIYEVPIMANPW